MENAADLNVMLTAGVTLWVSCLAILAHLSWNYRWAYLLHHVLIGVFVALTGIGALLAGLGWFISMYLPTAQGDLQVIGTHTAIEILGWFALILGGISLTSLIVLIPETRKTFYKILSLPAIPESPPHQLCIVLFALYLGFNLFNLAVYDFQTILQALRQSSFLDMVLAQFAFLAVTVVATGFIMRRNWKETTERLGFKKMSLKQVGVTIAIGVGFFWGSFLVETYLLEPLMPEVFAQLSQINDAVVSGRNVLPVILMGIFVSVTPAICEELFFRGILQPIVGFFPTAILFTVIHFHYGLSPALLSILLLALVLGWARNRYGLGAAMLIHFINNFSAAFLYPLVADYLIALF